MFRFISTRRLSELETTVERLSERLRLAHSENGSLKNSSEELRKSISSLQYELNLYQEKLKKLQDSHSHERTDVRAKILAIANKKPAVKQLLQSKRSIQRDLHAALRIIDQIKSYIQDC